MTVQLNHLIVWCRDKQRSATFLAEVLGLPAPRAFGPFVAVDLGNGVSMDFHDQEGKISPQHYAFLIREQAFDEVFARMRERGVGWWADPARRQPHEINRRDGGRGVYFEDPDGHFLEVITRPYGSGAG